jgi:hypothetical protein
MQTNLNKILNSIAIDNNIVQNALGNNKEILQCAYVRGGHFKSNYQDWVQHSEPSVRKLIAEKYPEYIPLLPCETDWEMIEVGNYLLKQTKPKLDVLEKFLANIELLEQSFKTIALQLKYVTLIREMTAIEKTMSRQQLWQANNPFWTEKLNGIAVVNVLRAYSLSEQSKEEFDIESVCDKAMDLLNQRLTSSRPYLNIDEIL